MKRTLRSFLKRSIHQFARGAFGLLPRAWRHGLFRRMVDCDFTPGPELELKIADTQDELEACFALLHDAYVGAGFMKPDPSGLRVTAYHALPTTTTLCAKVRGRVVGTVSVIREGVFGFPMQSVFDLSAVRAKPGRIAEVSALAVHKDYRGTGGRVLFPLMKFLHEYCTAYFDTRHLVIAVNPNKIELYESLLFFERLQATPVERYDFANGAPAVGAAVDLWQVRERMRAAYEGRAQRRNLYRFFYEHRLANIVEPARRYHTTNDPVMTEALIDHFFNRRTQVFAALDERKQLLLRSIYDLDDLATEPVRPAATPAPVLRGHQRYSINCPAHWETAHAAAPIALRVIELSLSGFQAECDRPLPAGASGRLTVELGNGERSLVHATVVRMVGQRGEAACHGFRIDKPDAAWAACVSALQAGRTHADLAPRAARPATAMPVPPELACA